MTPTELEEIKERLKRGWFEYRSPDSEALGADHVVQALLDHISYQDKALSQMQELTHLELIPEEPPSLISKVHHPAYFRWKLTSDDKIEGREELAAWLRSKGEKG